MSDPKSDQTTEAQLAVHWKEEEYYYPPTSFIAQANMTDATILDRFGEKNYPECFKEYFEPPVLEVVRRGRAERFL